MSYCALSDVQGRMRGPALTTLSTPTIAEVTEMIDDTSGEIDAALASHGVVVPVSSPSHMVAWLKGVAADGAAALAMTARFADSSGINSDSGAGRLEKRFLGAMARLWSGKGFPSSLDVTDESLPSSYGVAHPDEVPTMGDNAASYFTDDIKW